MRVLTVDDSRTILAMLHHTLSNAGFEVLQAEDGQKGLDVLKNESVDVVITDTWVSMGDQDHEARLHAFEPYAVDQALMDQAAEGAIFLHCLPAHRGEEVTDEVLDGPQSAVWDEAENRIHAQKSVLRWAFGQL